MGYSTCHLSIIDFRIINGTLPLPRQSGSVNT
jgi:hypothetical protein